MGRKLDMSSEPSPSAPPEAAEAQITPQEFFKSNGPAKKRKAAVTYKETSSSDESEVTPEPKKRTAKKAKVEVKTEVKTEVKVEVETKKNGATVAKNVKSQTKVKIVNQTILEERTGDTKLRVGAHVSIAGGTFRSYSSLFPVLIHLLTLHGRT